MWSKPRFTVVVYDQVASKTNDLLNGNIQLGLSFGSGHQFIPLVGPRNHNKPRNRYAVTHN